MIRRITTTLWHWISSKPGKITVYASVASLVCLLIFFFLPESYLDRILKSRITSALEQAYPAYAIRVSGLHYRVSENHLECDSVLLVKIDTSFSCSIAKFSVKGISRIQLLWGGGVAPDNLVSSHVDAQDIRLIFHRTGYELRCERLHVSVPDSEIVVDALDLHPLVGDESFFAGSKSSRARFHLAIPHGSLLGSACLSLFQGQIHCARTAVIHNPVLDVLIDKDKPPALDSLRPLMPNKLIASIMENIELDSLNIMNARLRYSERFAIGAKPAVLTFDSMQVLVEGFSNRVYHGDTVLIHAHGKLMQAGVLTVFMSIPISSPEFTLQYSGSLSRMGLSTLNPFIEVSEHKRFKTGVLQSAQFNVQATGGSARGNVRLVYKDLKIVAIDDHDGSEAGAGNTIVSFIANNIKLRTTNLPDKQGAMKIGEVKYTRARDDAFFAFTWFALRSGISDVVGF